MWWSATASIIKSVGLQRMKGHIVRVEANVGNEKEQYAIIELPDASIKESNEWVLSCLYFISFGLMLYFSYFRFYIPEDG